MKFILIALSILSSISLFTVHTTFAENAQSDLSVKISSKANKDVSSTVITLEIDNSGKKAVFIYFSEKYLVDLSLKSSDGKAEIIKEDIPASIEVSPTRIEPGAKHTFDIEMQDYFRFPSKGSFKFTWKAAIHYFIDGDGFKPPSKSLIGVGEIEVSK